MKFSAKQFWFEYCYSSDGKETLTELQIYQKQARERTILFHYTSFETLRLILKNKNLKFNRIDKVNDRMEHRLFGDDELSHLVFVSCFSTDEMESIPMWDIYGKDKNGLRISFELDEPDFVEKLLDRQGDTGIPSYEKGEKTYKNDELFRYGKLNAPCLDWSYDVRIQDIIYDIDSRERNPIRIGSGDDQKFNLTAMAAIKRREWQYEHECRMIATLRTCRDNVEAPDIDHILVPITFEHIKKLTITFNPWMEDSTKHEIRDCVGSISELRKVDVSFCDSILTGEVKEFK